MAKVIAVTNQKGGVGKTTTAVSLSINYALKGYRTCLIDIDPQANSTRCILGADQESKFTIDKIEAIVLNLAYDYGIITKERCLEIRDDFEYKKEAEMKGIYELLTNSRAVITDCIHKTPIENLEIIPAGVELAVAEDKMMNNAYLLKSIISDLSDRYDRIVIDSAPIVNLITYNILNASEQIIIPVKLDLFSIKGSFQTINYIQQMQTIMQKAGMANANTNYKVLATMAKKNMIISKVLIAVLQKVLGEHFMTTQIRQQDAAVLKTNSSQKHFSLNFGSKRYKIADDYVDLMNELEQEGL